MPIGLWQLLVLLALLATGPAWAAAPVLTLRVDGAIGPATTDYIQRGLSRATELGAQLVVLELDTPGGLDSATRDINKAILASPVPLACYVAPAGARAASAGTFILYACHIAAMAPGTNLGAATPVNLTGAAPGAGSPEKGDDALQRKALNDSAAYIRSLAELRGRNAEWAEQAVREAVSLSASEALNLRVVDLLAASQTQLLTKLDGRRLTTAAGEVRLDTAGAAVVHYAPDWRTRLLATITNPSVALILLMLGVYGLLLEFSSPGIGGGGVAGGICLLLALYALQLLPVNYAGVALILLGIAFMALEATVPSFGALGLGGVAAFVAGAVILIDTEAPGFGIPLALIVTLALTSLGLILAILSLAIKARRRRRASGDAELLGHRTPVLRVNADDPRRGWVHLHGENWQVTSEAPLQPGQSVEVQARRGLLLHVGACAPTSAEGEQ